MSFNTLIRTYAVALPLLAMAATPLAAQDVPRSSTEQAIPSQPNELAAGQEIDVRLQTTLDSDTAQPEDRVEATTAVDVLQDGRVLVPAGSIVRGVVSHVHRASRTDRSGELALHFDELQIGDRTFPVRANPVDTIKSEGLKDEAGRIAAGAGVGAIVGGIIGGVKGAITGILIGAGGTIVATEGKDVEVPAGTILRIRLDQPVYVGR